MVCLGGAAPESRALTAVLTVALFVAHFADARSGPRAHPAGWLFVPFLAYAAANAAWVSPVGWLGWADWFNWAQMLVVFWVVLNGLESEACRRFLAVGLVAMGVLAAALAVYQHYVRPDWIMTGRTQADQYIGRSSGPFGVPNSFGGLMALLIPPVGAVALGRHRPVRQRVLCAVALCALLAGFVLAVSRGAWISLALAFALRPLLTPGRSFGRRIVAAVSSVAAALAVGAVLYASFPMMRLRVNQLVTDFGERSRPILWRACLAIFREHPLLGGGAGSFDVLFERFRPQTFQNQPIYAHCDYLNTLSDYGALGFLLLFGAAAVVAWKCSRAQGLAAAAFTGLLAFSLHLFVDFHLKVPALAMIFATVAALVAQRAWPRSAAAVASAGPVPRSMALGTAAAAVALTLAWLVPASRAEALRSGARVTIDRMARAQVDVSTRGQALGEVRSMLEKATALDPSNARAWSDLAYAESLLALAHPAQTMQLGADVTRDAGRAIRLCPLIAEFWIRKGTGLDMQRLWLEGGDCTVHALQLAPARADVWYYQAYHLSLAEVEVGPAMAAADVCLRLDPGFLLAQLLRQRLEVRLKQHP
jgi:hypothetical protein